MNNNTVVAIGLLVIVVIGVILYRNYREKYGGRFSGPAYYNACEFQPACLWDTARWVRLSNGEEGVCTLHGMACPAFSKDHDRGRRMGLSPDMVDDMYMRRVTQKEYRSEEPAGETALELAM